VGIINNSQILSSMKPSNLSHRNTRNGMDSGIHANMSVGMPGSSNTAQSFIKQSRNNKDSLMSPLDSSGKK